MKGRIVQYPLMGGQKTRQDAKETGKGNKMRLLSETRVRE